MSCLRSRARRGVNIGNIILYFNATGTVCLSSRSPLQTSRTYCRGACMLGILLYTPDILETRHVEYTTVRSVTACVVDQKYQNSCVPSLLSWSGYVL